MRHFRHIARWTAGLSFLFCLTAPPTIAGIVPAPLAAAREATTQGRQSEAIATYLDYIETHPLLQSVFVKKDEHLAPSRIHNLLLAFAELTELQRLAGQEEARREILGKLDWVERNQAIDAINRYHLARVYLDNGKTPEGIGALEKIVSDQERFPNEEHNKVYLRACAKLLEVLPEQGRTGDAGRLADRLRQSLTLFSYDVRDLYKIARLLLEQGITDKAEDILLVITRESNPAVLKVEEFTIIQAAVKLLDLYAQRNDREAEDRLLKNLAKTFSDRPMAPRNQYLLALAVLETGREQMGREILARLQEAYPGSEWSAKAAALMNRENAAGGLY